MRIRSTPTSRSAGRGDDAGDAAADDDDVGIVLDRLPLGHRGEGVGEVAGEALVVADVDDVGPARDQAPIALEVVTGLDPLEVLVLAVAAHSASRCGVTAGSVGPRDTAVGQIHRATRPRPSTMPLGWISPMAGARPTGARRQRSPVEHSVGDLVDDGQGVPDALVGPLAEQTDVADGEDPRTVGAASGPRSGPAARASSSSATQSPVNTTVSHSTRDPSASSTASTRARPTTPTTSAPRRRGTRRARMAERKGREGVVSRLRRDHEDADARPLAA